MDYPSIENFPDPLYKTGASANDGDWSTPTSTAWSRRLHCWSGRHRQVPGGRRRLAQDMPVIPMWYGSVVAGYSGHGEQRAVHAVLAREPAGPSRTP